MHGPTRDELSPPVSWAQRRKELWLSFDIPNATNVTMLSPTDGEDLFLRFVDRDTQQPFCSHLNFYAPVKDFLGMPTVLSRCIRLKLLKRGSSEWPRLTQQRPKDLPFLVTYNWDIDSTLDEDSAGSSSSSSSSSESYCKCDEQPEAAGSRVEELDDCEEPPPHADTPADPPAAEPKTREARPVSAAATAPAPSVPVAKSKPKPSASEQPLDVVQVLLIIAITSVSSVIVTYLFMREPK